MSRIEQIIDEIEEFIESCKPAPFSQSKIVVPKDQLYELLTELRLKTPDEIRRYKKIIEQKDKIISDAKDQAQQMIDETQAYAEQLVEDHEIMLKAYEKADETIHAANDEAKGIIDQANATAMEITHGSLSYAKDLINNIQAAVSSSIDIVKSNTDGLVSGLSENMRLLTENNDSLAAQIESMGYDADAPISSPVRTRPEKKEDVSSVVEDILDDDEDEDIEDDFSEDDDAEDASVEDIDDEDEDEDDEDEDDEDEAPVKRGLGFLRRRSRDEQPSRDDNDEDEDDEDDFDDID